MTKIVCRAKVHPSCFDGKPSSAQFGRDLPLYEDGTYDGTSIVCDRCYVVVMRYSPSGMGLNRELDAAIKLARKSV